MEFVDYVLVYTEYMSYIHNKHRVTAEEREAAAKTLYSSFIAGSVPVGLKGRKLVEATILHLLQWCLGSEKLKGDAHTFALLVFRLYDFLVILDIGTVEEFIGWVDAIYNHSTFTSERKLIFLMRVG